MPKIFQFKSSKKGIKNILSIFKKWLWIKEKPGYFKRNQFIILDCILLLLVYIFLFNGLRMEWFLREIIPTGGDIPYHFANYIDFKEIFLPNWQITGWSDASFGGLNIFQSYPVFAFILIYFFDLFMGSWVAFKTVLILGSVGLPLAIYWTLIQAKVPRPWPIFGSIASLAFLFHDDHFSFGGNLRSVFSGEFAHSLSILFLVIFCGFLFQAFENKKYIPHTIITLALIGFTHPTSFMVAIFLPLFFLIKDGEKEEEWWFFSEASTTFKIMLIGGLLFCTWAIWYIAVSHYGGVQMSDIVSKSYGWSWMKIYQLIPKVLFPFAILFISIVICSLFYPKKISRTQSLFLLWLIISISFYLIKFMWHGVRFLPWAYLFCLLFVAATVGWWYKNAGAKIQILLYSIVILSFVSIFGYVYKNNIFEKYQETSWFVFEWAEAHWEWTSIVLISRFLSENFDTQTENSKQGWYPPRVFSVNKWDIFRVTSYATLYDSLFSESFFGSQGRWGNHKIKERRISPEKIWSYLELSNIKIVIAPKDLANYLKNTPYFSLKETLNQYTIFETKKTSSRYIVPLKNQVYALSDLNQWRKTSRRWYENYSKSFFSGQETAFIVHDPLGKKSPFKEYNPKETKNDLYATNCTVQEVVQREKIHIQTNCIGRPLLVKIAYHPNWKVTGAKQVYLATPAFMIIVPEQNDITLYFGKQPYNYLAYMCGLLGIILLFTYGLVEKYSISAAKRIYKNHKKAWGKLFQLIEKVRIQNIWRVLWEQSTSILLILTLLISIALVYSVK